MYRADTIVACATPPGRGAVSIIRLSGTESFAVAERIFVPSGAAPSEPWKLRLGRAVEPVEGQTAAPIDEVLAVLMPAPRSYTGEDVVEIHCHGSPLIVERILAASVAAGARLAEAGEFTRRAVLNGRIDLVQAEAVAALIDARVGAGARLAWEQLQGGLSRHLRELRSRLVAALAAIEAGVDFSDEELPEEHPQASARELAEVAGAIDALLASFVVARRVAEGQRVVFTGRPNVGKSSLVNALLGHGRMIVSEEAGTTRDTVDELVDLDGAALVLTDTAGMRQSKSEAESAAVERARATAERADLVVLVLDGSEPLTADDHGLLAWIGSRPGLVVLNKSDLATGLDPGDRRAVEQTGTLVLGVSALTGRGCDELAAALRRMALDGAASEGQPSLITRARHHAALTRARSRLEAGRELAAAAAGPELVALELRACLTELASITDPVDNEDVLDVIFSQFCIGK